MDRYGKFSGSAGENIAYGHSSCGAQIVAQLHIDDGVPNRGHRTNMYMPAFTQVGIFTGKHKKYRHETVLNYMGSNSPIQVNIPNTPIP
jgi:uncharacterized protein YkwD